MNFFKKWFFNKPDKPLSFGEGLFVQVDENEVLSMTVNWGHTGNPTKDTDAARRLAIMLSLLVHGDLTEQLIAAVEQAGRRLNSPAVSAGVINHLIHCEEHLANHEKEEAGPHVPSPCEVFEVNDHGH